MSLKFSCDECGEKVIVRYLKPGDTAQCKSCGAENIVPRDAAATDEMPPKARRIRWVPRPNSDCAEPEPQDFPTAPVTLTSEGAGTLILVLLWISLGLSIIQPAIALASVGMSDYIMESLRDLCDYDRVVFGSDGLNRAIVQGMFGVGLAGLMLLAVWLFRAHRDLAGLYPGYEITPGQALARTLIPLYNVWGIWSVVATLSRRLKRGSDGSRRLGKSLFMWLVLTYVSAVALEIPYRLMLSHPPWVVMFLAGVVFSTVAEIFVVQFFRKGLRHRCAIVRQGLAGRLQTG
jgi:hypothetical protein